MSERPKERTGGDILADRVKSWLSDQGYPLEMRAARIMREARIPVVQSDFYLDPEGASYREIDLTARIRLQPTRHDLPVPSFLCPVIECKSSPGKPWVLFSGGVHLAQPARLFQRFVSSQAFKYWHQFAMRVSKGPEGMEGLPLFEIEEDPAYSAVRTSLGKSREDAAYGAMVSVSKASLAVANRYNAPGREALQVAVPVIVVDSPIFKCSLDSEAEPQLKQVGSGTIVWRNQVNGYGLAHSIIRICHISELNALCSDISITAKTLEREILANPWPGPDGN
ncbi:hypothetical protein [Streptomyces sp. RKCA744]|uniref:hypothetical protein n=1 Tax=Streptomyces sp. RKCA744 TaxID=2959340 RepID=UPI00209F477F|nr:hypothetical protein [Streptomyces sp. RKCA744]MCO8307005.1 hypothetical protein [Streptomyces sp. RKCA744]